jgi:hypothetical protein
MQKTWIWIAAGLIAAGVTARLVYIYRSRIRPVVLSGAVIREDADPRKQVPIANVTVTVAGGAADEYARSDASGLFKLAVHPFLLQRNRPISLRFEHAGYQPLEINTGSSDRLYVVRMAPLVTKSAGGQDHPESTAKAVQIANVRLRYSVKNETTIAVGSVVKQFDVVNTGDVPCRGHLPCSPGGKWKASTGKLSLDAGNGNEFRNVRASCIAGPCPFTRLAPNDLSRPSRKIEITAFDWSDTVSFLVEAEVTRTMTTDMVRQSYPFNIGQTMSFALPAAAEGPSIIADLNGQEIVFPLGPTLNLSWTTCSVEVAQGGNKLYRCELKPGYQFRQ